MHGFQNGFELGVLKGLEVSQVFLGRWERQIIFSDVARLSMQGTYIHQIRSESREFVQAGSCGPNELFRLLGQSVTDLRVIAPKSFEITFSNGDALILVDDSDQYESFAITLRDRAIVV